MSDKSSPQPRSVDLELIAHLIEQSSLGAPQARLARDQVEPASVMALRERAGLDTATRGWELLSESTAVLHELGNIMPPSSGCTQTFDRSEASGSICAVNNRGEILYARGATLDLPGKAERTQWYVYSATNVKRRCEIQLVVGDPGAPVGREHTWEIDIAMVWEIVDRDEVLRRRICRIDVDLTVTMRACVQPHLRGASGSMGLAARIRMERDLEATLRSCGLLVGVVTRPRSVRQLQHFVQDLAVLITRVEPNRTFEQYRDDIDLALAEAAESHAEQAQFCRDVFPSFVEALRVADVDVETATKVARSAFGRILREWDSVRGTDRVFYLASIAIGWLNSAVEQGSATVTLSGANWLVEPAKRT